MPVPLDKISFREPNAYSGPRTRWRIPILLGFFAWSVAFIVKNSYLGPDGVRYYWLFDDAMISMRYAWNLAHGHGLVWNQGEYVEGYTNLLLILFMTVGHWVASLRIAPLLFQIFNLGLAYLTAHHVLKLIHMLGENRGHSPDTLAWAKDATLVLLFTYFPYAYWTLLGMETTLLTLLIVLSVKNLLLPVNVVYPWACDVILGALFGAAYLTRPDSVLLTGPLWVGLLWVSWNQWPRRKPFLVAGIFLAVVIGHLLFRKFYYGEWMPNTFYLKATGLGLWDSIKNGFLFLTPFFGQTALLFLLLLVALGTGSFPIFSGLSLLFTLILVGYHLWIGGDAFLGLWRLMIPAMPFVFISVSLFLAKLFHETLPLTKKQKAAAMMAVVGMLSFWQNKDFLIGMSLREVPGRRLAYHFLETSIALGDLLTPGASVGVFSAGILPYYLPQVRGVDFLGKCDRYIARTAPHLNENKGLLTQPGHNKYDLAYSVLKLKPTFIEHAKWYDNDVSREATVFYGGYVYRGKTLFLLKDSPYVQWDKLRR